jgi:hypothetical protein
MLDHCAYAPRCGGSITCGGWAPRRRSLGARRVPLLLRGAVLAVACVAVQACAGTAVDQHQGTAAPNRAPTTASPATEEIAAGSALQGSPGARWPVGAAGLGSAPTEPPDGFTQATLNRAVAYAEEQLVAGNLDEDTVYRRGTKPFIAATSERNRPEYLDLLASPAGGGRPYTLVSRLPGEAKPDGEVRVKGRYAVKAKMINGERYMSLTWRGTFLYPVRDAKGRSTAVVVHRRATWNWANDPDWAPGEHWYFEIGNADQCATQRSGLLVPDYTADHLAQAAAAPYGGGAQADNIDELDQRC